MSGTASRRWFAGEPHPTGLGPSRWILAAVISAIGVLIVYVLVAGFYGAARTNEIDADYRKAAPLLTDAAKEDLLGNYPLVVKGDRSGFAPFEVLDVNDAGRALANAAEERIRESRKKRDAGPEPAGPETPSARAIDSAAPLPAAAIPVLKSVAASAPPGFAAKFFGYEQLAMYMMAALAMLVLCGQLAEVRRQRRRLEADASVLGQAKLIRPEDAGLLITRLQQGDSREGVGRYVAIQLLRRFERTGEIDSAAAAGDSAIATVDAELVARLNVVRFATWAIPTVGFIGTVRGIGGALSVASSPERLPAVVGFLGVAFDTTMVGLILCLAVVLLSHELDRLTDRFLDELSGNAVGAVQRRLRQDGAAPRGEP